jgi:hypothetical protein
MPAESVYFNSQPQGADPMANDLSQSVYQQNGFDNREAYLNSLREDYGGLVDILTSILPPSEDFDGLVTELEDAMDSGEYDELI